MRRLARWSGRGAILVLLALAVADPAVPGAGPRRRVYVVDASSSVARGGGHDAFTPEDALRLAAHDAKSFRGGRVALVAFGAKPAILSPLGPAEEARFPSKIDGVDPSSTDLGAAIDLARAIAEGGEIVLFSDGRSTTGPPALESLRVPTHAFPLGPLGGVDASIAAIDAPATAAPGAKVTVRITVEASGAWRGTLLGRPLEFSGPGRQDVVIETMETRLAPKLAGERPDSCPENDGAEVAVIAESDALRILVVNSTGPTGLSAAFGGPAWSASDATDLRDAGAADVVVLERLAAAAVPRAEVERLARRVREEGVGLVVLGGSSAFAAGGWAGTPVEEILPCWATPDERTAVVVVLDRSGSMAEPAPGRSRPRIEEAAAAVRRSLELAHDDDEVALITFAESAEVRCPLVPGRERGRAAAALERITAGGPTGLAPALELARSTALGSKSGRRRVVLVTDGQSTGEEDRLRSIARLLREESIGMTIVRTGESSPPALAILRDSGADEIDGSDVALWETRLAEAMAKSREFTGPVNEGLSFVGPLAGLAESPRPERINRVSLKPASEVVARSGTVPIAALRPAGRGRVAAAVLALESGWAGELAGWGGWPEFVARLAGTVAPPGSGRPASAALRFTGGRLEISARVSGTDRPEALEALLDGQPIRLERRGENVYEASLVHDGQSATLRVGGRIAGVARRPHPPEYDRVGPDFESLKRIAAATGGTLLEAPRDLAALPGRAPSEPRSIRLPLLLAALVLLLLDAAAALWPHARRR